MLLYITLLPDDAGQHQAILVEALYGLAPGVPDIIGLFVVALYPLVSRGAMLGTKKWRNAGHQGMAEASPTSLLRSGVPEHVVVVRQCFRCCWPG
jgi:hypothetical protein